MLIYKATNNINGKIYVGQTTLSLDERIYRHKKDFKAYLKHKKSGSRFYESVNQHGWEHFSFSIIEYCNTKEELNDREFFWINHLKTMNNKYGYNVKPGGNKSGYLDETRRKISKKKQENFKDKEFSEAVIKGLRKGTLVWQEKCKNNRHSIFCQTCGKEIPDLAKWAREKYKFCSNKCAFEAKQSYMINQAKLKCVEEKKKLEAKAEIAFQKCLDLGITDTKEIVSIVGEEINKKDYRTVIKHITKDKGQGWRALESYINER